MAFIALKELWHDPSTRNVVSIVWHVLSLNVFSVPLHVSAPIAQPQSLHARFAGPPTQWGVENGEPAGHPTGAPGIMMQTL